MKNFTTIAIFILVIGIAIFLQRKYFPNEVIVERVDTVYSYTTITNTVYRDSIKPVYVYLPQDTIYIPTDTTELIARYKNLWREYYSRKGYKQEFALDTFGTATITSKITQNRLDSTIFEFNLKIPEKTITKVVVPKNSLYIGGLIGSRNVSPIIMCSYKNKYNGFVGYNLIEGGVQAGVLININSLKLK